jgi:hypothetical protein
MPAHLHKNLSAVFVLASIEEFLNELAVSWGSISLLAKSHVLMNRNEEATGVKNWEGFRDSFSSISSRNRGNRKKSRIDRAATVVM